MKKILAINMTAIVVVDVDEDVQLLEEALAGSIQTTPGIHYSNLHDVLIDTVAEQAFCCPICSMPITVTTQLRGTYASELDMANGVPTGGSFNGDEHTSYACSGDSSHDVSDVVEPLNKAACILPRDL